MKVIIVDDEARARDVLSAMLKQHFPAIEVLGEAQNVPEAVRLIHKHQPDLVFLDIEMPMYSGLELLDFFGKDEVNFKLIFVTAYAEHAIQAFRLSALDYLLKPIQLEQLASAIVRAGGEQSEHQLQALKYNYVGLEPRKIAISLSDGLSIIPLPDIAYIKADGAYVQLHLTNGKKIMAAKSLSDFNFLCENENFFRTHRSYMVNLSAVRKISRNGNDVVLNDAQEIPITIEKKAELLEKFKSIKV